MQKQRVVSVALGRNITHLHEEIYNNLKQVKGEYLKCNFGLVKGSKTGVKHEGDSYVPITNFELKRLGLDSDGNILWGLQGFCKDCEKRKRRARLDNSRETNVEGYEGYEKKYGNTKCCSVCKEEKSVRENFKLSPSMDCGLHNVCNVCSKKYGESVGDRWIKYRPDGNFKYNKTEKNQHDDHIMPLKYGGSNEKINHQLLSDKENLEKSDTIPFDNVMDINPLLLSKRWRPILYEAQREKIDILTFKSRIDKAIRDESIALSEKSDIDIMKYFDNYNKEWNMRKDTERATKKFKDLMKLL